MNGTLGTIARDLGRMLQALSGLVFVSMVVSVVWGEFYAIPALLVAGALPLLVGTVLARTFADAADPGKLHGMMIAASGWFLVALFGSVPFALIAWTAAYDHVIPLVEVPARVETATLANFRQPLNAVFESMSGFTGTGLTMTIHEPLLPHTLQWWRSFTEWVGGVGVIVLTTAILARPGSGSLTLYESEARSEKIHPSIVSTVRTIWWIFLLFTLLAIVILWLAGMPLWDSINHAMTALSTGGFSVTDNSIGTYDSALIDAALLPVMTLGAIAFPVHYLLLQGDFEQLYRDLQTRWVILYFTAGLVTLTGLLYANGAYAQAGSTLAQLGTALRYGAFQFVSAASCTGFQTAGSLGQTWSAESQLVVAFGMVVGGAAGSTVGGIKLIRGITLTKGTTHRIAGVFYPDSAVRPFSLDGRKLTSEAAAREFQEASIIAFLWFVFLAVGLFVLLAVVPESFTLENVVFEVASAQGNVGLSTGITGPSMSTVAKLTLLFNMWIGRLEIIPVIVLLRSIVWRTAGVSGA